MLSLRAPPTQSSAACRCSKCSGSEFIVGHEPPKANLVKLSGNFLITSVIEALGEAFALVGKAGIDRAQFLDVVTGTLFAPIYKTYGGLIAEERYHPAGFKAELGYKDIRLALAAAEALKVPMPLASLIATRRLALIAQGGGHLDWSAMAKLAARDAGLATTPHSSQ
jgi:3-hydroxyisobutyrate dehydrogenase-like beta-hydroxyacid dehydrogenase